MVSRITFLECGGNSAPLFSPEPIQDIHHQPEAQHLKSSAIHKLGWPITRRLCP
jgi:hypothetical protein